MASEAITRNDLTEILDKVLPATPIIIIKAVSLGSQTVSAGSTKAVDLYPACIAAKPEGYNFIGIAGFATNHGSCVVMAVRPLSGQYSFEYRNVATSAVTSSPAVFAMYGKAGIAVMQ